MNTALDLLSLLLEQARAGEPKGPICDQLWESLPDLSKLPAAKTAQFFAALRRLHGYAGEVDRLEREIRQARKAPHLRVVTEEDEEDASFELPSGLPEGWCTPEGWLLTTGGVQRKVKDPEAGIVLRPVTLAPIWIAERWQDIDTGEHAVTLRWPGGQQTVARGFAMSAKDLPTLATRGAPVSSRSARDVVAWLEDSESSNAEVVPLLSCVGRVGWLEGGALQLGDGPSLLRADDGAEQAAKALAPKGTWDGWLKVAKEVNQHVVPAYMLACSAASIMLPFTGAAPFVLDLHGHTSQGKTTASRWAASLWADPTDRGAYILPWSASLAAIEARASFLRNLPVFLDDSKKVEARNRPILSTVVYQWGSGQGKARGKIDGARKVATWQSVLFSTGEASLTRLAGEHAGMHLRVLPISESPFPSNALAVAEVDNLEHWGHAGRHIEAWVLAKQSRLAEMWTEIRDQALSYLGDEPAARRVAGYLATVGLGAKCLRDIGVPMPEPEALRAPALAAARRALRGSDTASEAFERIESWLASQKGRLINPSDTERPAPPNGWLGRIQTSHVAVIPSALDDELRRMGFDPEEIIPLWVKRGKLIGDERRTTRAVRLCGNVVRMYCIKVWEAVEEDPDTGVPLD
jgi:hypothetical protein